VPGSTRPLRTERLILLLATACSSSRAGDPVIGTWSGGKGAAFELRDDGHLDKAPTFDSRCADEVASIAACRARQTWEHRGPVVTLRMGVIRDTASAQGSLTGMFAEPRSGERCECVLDPVEVQYTGDALVVGKERAVRVR
jgi:hypothetical protein